MLRPLLFLLLFLGGSAAALTWVRSRLRGSASRRRALGSAEIKEMTKEGRRTPQLERALELRRKIADAVGGRKDADRIEERVDDALRRLLEQARLRRRIRDAIGAAPDLDPRVEENVDAFEERQVRLSRLEEHGRSLERELERGLLELSNLHLALLDLSAEASLEDGGALGEALGELESAGEQARQQREAEAEVARFVAAQRRLRN